VRTILLTADAATGRVCLMGVSQRAMQPAAGAATIAVPGGAGGSPARQ
jgi:hypothetical protein